MCQYFETIRVTDGIINNLSYHHKRMNDTRQHFWPGCDILCLEDILSDCKVFTGKAKVCYNGDGFTTVSILEYKMRQIKSLKIVTDDIIDYSYKGIDRSSLDKLSAQKGNKDDILIVKNGLITDTSYTNVVLSDGTAWHTPKHPLLKGTMRQYLLDRNIISEKDIKLDDLHTYREIRLINAMIDFGQICIDIKEI